MDSSNFQPPIRRSLSNEELEARVNQAMSSHSGVETAMELLVSQEALRSQEDRELAAWIENMQQIGSPEALRALEGYRQSEQGIFVPVQEQPLIEAIQEPKVEPVEVASSLFTVPETEIQSTEEVEQTVLNQNETNAPSANPVVEPFSWFTKTSEPVEANTAEAPEQSQVSASPLTVNEQVTSLEPIGSETRTDFEALLAAAAAEEELTALEEKKSKPEVTSKKAKQKKEKKQATNTRKSGIGSPVIIWLGLTALVAPIALVWALIGSGISSTAMAITFGVAILVSGSLIAHAALASRRNSSLPTEVTGLPSQSEQETILVPTQVEEHRFEVAVTTSHPLVEMEAVEEKPEALGQSSTEPVSQAIETNVLIPSDEFRNRGFTSQLLVWFGLSSTLAPIVLVWSLIGSGLSAPVIAVVLSVGYLVSGSLIALAVLAGKRSGQSTSTTARAVFGVWGNALPSGLLFVSRVAIAALLIGTFSYLMNGVEARIPDFNTVLASTSGFSVTVGLVVQIGFLIIVTALAAVRGGAARIIQVSFSVLAFALVAESFVSLTVNPIALQASGTKGVISESALAGVGMILMVNLTLWFAVAPNLSKAIPTNVKSYKVYIAAFVSNFVAPVLVGVVSLLWLGQVSLEASEGFSLQDAVLGLPNWAQGSLMSGIALALVYAVLLSARSAALDLVSVFRLKGKISALVMSVTAVASLLALFAQQPSSQQVEYLLNVFVLVSAVSAGWIGIFAGDGLVRKIPYHELSLARAYGVYKKFNLMSLFTWFITIAFAIAFMPVNLYGMNFMGFALPVLGLEPSVSISALGFTATVLLGFLLTIIFRVPQIRRQEAEINELEARREQLNDIFLVTE